MQPLYSTASDLLFRLSFILTFLNAERAKGASAAVTKWNTRGSQTQRAFQHDVRPCRQA